MTGMYRARLCIFYGGTSVTRGLEWGHGMDDRPLCYANHSRGIVMNTMKRIVALTTAAILATAALSACNTVEGVGKDVKSTGKAIERTAN